MKSIPLVPLLTTVWDACFVDRSTSVDHVSGQLQTWQSDRTKLPIVVFPEGKVTNGEALLGFRCGAFVSDEKCQAITIRYKLWFTPKGMSTPSWLEMQLQDYLYQIWAIPWMTVDIHVLELLDLKGKTAKQRAAALELQMANFLGVRATRKTNKSLFRHPKST
jgi:hypothetical protein